MLKRETKTIGEHEYAVTQLDAVKGRRVATRIAKILAPVVGAGSAETGDMAKALQALVAGMTEEDVDSLCDVFAASTDVQIPGEKRSPKLSAIFALHFAGRYDEMVEWLLFCIEVNFSSFFARAGLKRASIEDVQPTGSK
jgi:hypothetical protein